MIKDTGAGSTYEKFPAAANAKRRWCSITRKISLSLNNDIKATKRWLNTRAHVWDTSCFLMTAANFGSGAGVQCLCNLRQDIDYKHCFPEILLCIAQNCFQRQLKLTLHLLSIEVRSSIKTINSLWAGDQGPDSSSRFLQGSFIYNTTKPGPFPSQRAITTLLQCPLVVHMCHPGQGLVN